MHHQLSQLLSVHRRTACCSEVLPQVAASTTGQEGYAEWVQPQKRPLDSLSGGMKALCAENSASREALTFRITLVDRPLLLFVRLH